MMINNPSSGIRLIDLIPMYDASFMYTDIYQTVGDYLDDLKTSFYTNDEKLWKSFIEKFCDRYYSDYMNFDTYLEFKIKLKSVLDMNKEVCEVIAKAKATEYDIMVTSERHYNSRDFDNFVHNTLNNSNTQNSQTTNGTNESTSTNKDSNSGYDLHSDTPSDSVNVKDLASGGINYVTDVNNNRSDSTSENDTKGITSSDMNGTSTVESNMHEDSENNRTHEDSTTEINKNPIELINSLFRLNNDICKYLFDCIDDAHLFSNTYYF